MIVEVTDSDYFFEALNTDYIERVVVAPDDGGAGWMVRLIIQSGNLKFRFDAIDEAVENANMWMDRMRKAIDVV